MNDTTDTVIRALVDAEPPFRGAPDLASLQQAGRRRLHRRRAVSGVAAVVAAGVLTVPALLAVSGDDERAIEPVATPPPAETQCGQLLCVDPRRSEYSPEKAQVIGQWVGNDLGNGAEEVLYVARARGTNLRTGDREMVDVLMLGYRYQGELHRVVWATQPGTDGISPEGKPSSFYLNPLEDEYAVAGFVEGTHDRITWSTPDGDSGPVDGVITDALPGYTLFHITRPLPKGYGAPGKPTVRTKKGTPHVELGAGGAWPPALTIHTPDGWSCSLADCGVSG